jgi:hypothetical protein
MAAAGAQNKEIAGALFISVKTVEANLSRVYTKLGIRSRTELAAELSKRDDTNEGSPFQPHAGTSKGGRGGRDS